MQWFRLYSEFATDPKVQTMPEVMQRRLIMLYCLQSSGEYEKLSHGEIAFALRLEDETLHETFQLFQSKGFLDKNNQIKNWDKRQYKSDNSTIRVKKYREKTKAKKNETFQKRKRNVTVTPPDTDTESEINNPITPLPENWQEFVQHRKEIKKPITKTQQGRLLKKISRLASESNCKPEAILEQSIENGWQGVFALKREKVTGNMFTKSATPPGKNRKVL